MLWQRNVQVDLLWQANITSKEASIVSKIRSARGSLDILPTSDLGQISLCIYAARHVMMRLEVHKIYF